VSPRPAETKATNLPAGADQELRLNFRNAPLEMVLNYLSEAAGFVILMKPYHLAELERQVSLALHAVLGNIDPTS